MEHRYILEWGENAFEDFVEEQNYSYKYIETRLKC